MSIDLRALKSLKEFIHSGFCYEESLISVQFGVLCKLGAWQIPPIGSIKKIPHIALETYKSSRADLNIRRENICTVTSIV